MGDPLLVSLLGGADKIGGGDVELLPERLKALYYPIRQLQRGFSRSIGGFFHLLAVFVGAGQEEHLVSLEPFVAGQHVGRQGGVGVANVGNVVDIVDRGGEVKGATHGFSL